MTAFIEKQFPVSKLSKESDKERKAAQSQTITGLGKWWGRKPLILVRAAVLGCLMPASDNPRRDMEIFLNEVVSQIASMQALDDKEDPNFSDPDYVLAAYAASLKVLTTYSVIGEIDLDYELNLAIHEPARSKVVALIERAKKQAYDCIIPTGFDPFLWKKLSLSECFYIKGLESEKNGNYQISTYQEYARGFAIISYSQLMANERANTCRLKTPTEFAMRTIGDVTGFENSTLRLVLAAIHIALKEDEKPDKGMWHLKNNLPDYWASRDMLKQLLLFLKDTKDIANMRHWSEAAQMAEHIYILVDNDHI